jgi:hypothetical protein
MIAWLSCTIRVVRRQDIGGERPFTLRGRSPVDTA